MLMLLFGSYFAKESGVMIPVEDFGLVYQATASWCKPIVVKTVAWHVGLEAVLLLQVAGMAALLVVNLVVNLGANLGANLVEVGNQVGDQVGPLVKPQVGVLVQFLWHMELQVHTLFVANLA